MTKNILLQYKSHARQIALAAVLGLAVLVTVIVLRPSRAEGDTVKAPAAPPVQVTTAKVKVENVPIVQTSSGYVLSAASVVVKARIDGQLESVEFKEGQDVAAGQLLARIDARSYQAQLDQATAQQAKDEALLANAETDLQRYKALIKDDATTQQVLDTQESLVKQLRATARNDQALVSLARVQLSYTQISAPISGRIGARLVDPGNMVHATDTSGLLVINQIDPIAMQFALPESLFQALNQATHDSRKPLKVEALDRSSMQVLANGELVLVNNQIDTSTGTISLKAHFPNAAHKLWPGQSLNVRITLGEYVDALTVPASAIQRGQSGFFVYAVESNETVRMAPVDIAQMDKQSTVVSKGLSAGERVVVDGQYRLTPGAHVVESKTGATAATSTVSEARP
jgi:membrane fusion protein, multidrug efflux system